MISEIVDIKGEVELDKESGGACETQTGIDPSIQMDCYKGIRDIFSEWDSDEGVSGDPQSRGSYRERHSEGKRLETGSEREGK